MEAIDVVNIKEKAKSILHEVLEGIDILCWEITDDTPCECYAAYNCLDLHTAAQQFVGWSRVNIDEKDIEFLKSLNTTIYDEIEREYHEVLIKIIEELCK